MHARSIATCFLLGACLLWSQASPQRIVIKTGNLQLTAQDLEGAKQAAAGSKLQIIDSEAPPDTSSAGLWVADQYVVELLLAEQAIRDHLDQAAAYPRQGTALERANWLSSAELKKINETPIASEEIQRYYAAHASEFERVEVHAAGIRKRTSATAPGLPANEATERAAAIQKAFEDHVDFQRIAAQFALPGVVVVDSRVIERGEFPPDAEQQVFTAKDADILNAESTGDDIVIVQVVRHLRPAVQEVSPVIESAVRTEKLQTLLKNLRKNTRTSVDKKYFNAGP